ncbi:YmfQ family protein [Enterobacter cloacae]
MNTVDLFRALMPPVSYDPNGKYLSAELTAEARVMDDVKASARRVLASITPFNASVTLADWERVYAITPRTGATVQERRQNVLVRMSATGGLSIPYFKNLAASLGYTITITEPRAFRTGVNRCGDRLYIDGMRWVWQVNVQGASTPKYRFRCGSSAVGEPLLAFGESILETTFKDLKPAFTDCYFTYEDDE